MNAEDFRETFETNISDISKQSYSTSTEYSELELKESSETAPAGG